MNQFTNYLRATIAEMKHVSWPSQSQTFIYAGLVIAISTLVALFIFFFDQLFRYALGLIGINF